jgi:hypothetical protein
MGFLAQKHHNGIQVHAEVLFFVYTPLFMELLKNPKCKN